MPDVIFPNMGIEINNLSRVAFSVFGLDIYFYGLIICSGILAGTYYAIHEAKRTGQDPDIYTNFLYYVIITSVIGARLYYVIFTWDEYKDNLIKIFATREGGLAIYGGVIFAVLTAIWYTKKHKLNFWLFADTTAPGLILGQAIGRWGNFFNREAFGGFTDSLFAMQLKIDPFLYVPNILKEHIIYVNESPYIQVHPTFLYESLWCAFVFALMNIYKIRKKTDGSIFCLYLAGYGLGRFFIEGLRTDQLYLWGTNIAISQILSFILLIFGILLFLRIKNKNLNK